MGSFNMTCSLTNLTIGDYDKVRCFILSKRIYDNGQVQCYPAYNLRSFPIAGSYADYGNISNIISTPIVEKLMKQSFINDVIEDGIVSKEMSFEYWYEAIYSGRVFVNRHNYNHVWKKHFPLENNRIIENDPDKTSQISLALVREDVIQTLLTYKIDDYEPKTYKRIKIGLSHYINCVKDLWDFDCNRKNEFDKSMSDESLKEYERSRILQEYLHPISSYDGFRDHDCLFQLIHDHCRENFHYSLHHSWKDAIGNVPENEVEDFLRIVAETLFLESVSFHLRLQFRPATSHGPQIGDWKAHEKYHKDMRTICNKINKVKKERGY